MARDRETVMTTTAGHAASAASATSWLAALEREVDDKLDASAASWRVLQATRDYLRLLAREWRPEQANSAFRVLETVVAGLSPQERHELRLRTALVKIWFEHAAREALTYHNAHAVEAAAAAEDMGLSLPEFLLWAVESDLIFQQQLIQAACGVPTPRHGLILASLAAVRQVADYSQIALAKQAGVGERVITHAENGHLTKTTTARKLARALHVAMADLL